MTSQLTGPFYVARYLPRDHQQADAAVSDRISEHKEFAEAIISARRHTLHPAFPSKPAHACVYVEHDQVREIVWSSI
ncbi:MAG: hypothetical protein H0W78_13365 [Planctomycetes bacterium]|nr:hypothetical protein [Planctomycetota bacterium]